jgi:UDP-sugar transporter A1/2/3
MVISLGVLHAQVGSEALPLLWQHVVVQWRDTLRVGVPAVLYLIQNNLLYVATSHLDAATCQVAYQLKLLTTAFFSVALLRRHISPRRWMALGLLFVGVVLVQTPSGAPKAAVHGAMQSPVLGMAAVGGACLLSGLSGVWLERIVKRSTEVPIWVRNIQLGLISLVIGLASVQYFDGAKIAQGGFFQGYTWVTTFVVMQVSAGGLLVGLIMKYADNVIKGFATSLSIILSSVLSSFIPAFDFSPSMAFLGGSSLVIAATLLYSSPAPTKKATPSERWLESNRQGGLPKEIDNV